jgi:FtsZ-interacting cell division protein ZipA
MTILLAVAILALVALVVYRDLLWEQRISKLTIKADADLARSRAETAAERVAAAEERRELYQRIQAPEIAVHDAQLEARRERPYKRRQPIGADDDKAFAARDKEESGS